MASMPLNKIEKAHQLYRDGRYEEAQVFYTEALSMAKTKGQKIALHSNRAACYLKMHHFKKAAEECTSVLELDHNHTGALMLRAQTLVTLKEYHSALFDVNRLLELNPSSEVYQNLEARLRTQLSLAPIPESEGELEEEEESDEARPYKTKEKEEQDYKIEDKVVAVVRNDHKAEESCTKNAEGDVPGATGIKKSSSEETNPKNVIGTTAKGVVSSLEHSVKDSKGWQAIPKPKGHSTLDYGRWDRVEDDSSEEEDDDDDDDSQPQYRFRVRTVGVRPVK